MRLIQPELFPQGYTLKSIDLPDAAKNYVVAKNWGELDQLFHELLVPGGSVWNDLQKFHDFTSIETMISVRDSKNEWEEDGIWHDDGSRVFAFSLSLTLDAQTIQGGKLEIKHLESEKLVSVATPPFGTAILFLTGVHGYVHRIRKVEAGTRIVLVGWCSAI
jgi:hypothetical protein